MKQFLSIVTASLFLFSCGNGTQKAASDASEEGGQAKTEITTKASKIDLGDKFSYGGLDTKKLIPSFAKEVSETEKSLDTHLTRGAYLYVGEKVDVITPKQLNEWLSALYDAAKAASDDGKVYKPGPFGDPKRGDEITAPVTSEKSYGEFHCIYQHDGEWFCFDASEKVQHDDFVKEYPGKYYGVKLYLRGRYNVIVE